MLAKGSTTGMGLPSHQAHPPLASTATGASACPSRSAGAGACISLFCSLAGGFSWEVKGSWMQGAKSQCLFCTSINKFPKKKKIRNSLYASTSFKTGETNISWTLSPVPNPHQHSAHGREMDTPHHQRQEGRGEFEHTSDPEDK